MKNSVFLVVSFFSNNFNCLDLSFYKMFSTCQLFLETMRKSAKNIDQLNVLQSICRSHEKL